MDSNRYSRIISDEPMRKYLYEHHITPDNYRENEEQLRRFFPDEVSWKLFVREYLTQVPLLSYHAFLKPEQRMDLFLHPRYIQQGNHMHDFIEMKYQLAGNGTVYIGEETIFLRESDLCLISPYVPHRNEVYSDDASMVNIVLPIEYLQVIFPRLMGFPNGFRDYFERLSDAPAQPGEKWLHLPTGRHAETRRLVAGAVAYFSSDSRRSRTGDLRQENAMEQVLLWMLEMNPVLNGTTAGKTGGDQLIKRIMEFLSLHLEDANLTDVAGALHYSATYISRVVRRQTGYTFQMLLLIMRMEAAARLMRQTNLSVDQIAASVGLTGKTYFYEKFRAFYGVNPGEYRRRILGT